MGASNRALPTLPMTCTEALDWAIMQIDPYFDGVCKYCGGGTVHRKGCQYMTVVELHEKTSADLRDTFKQRLLRHRNSMRITQEEAAVRCEINKTQYNKYENGDRLPDLETLNKICKGLWVASDYLLGLE